MRDAQQISEQLAQRIQADYPEAFFIETHGLPIGCVFVIGHPKGKSREHFVVGLISDDTKGCAVLKRYPDQEAARLLGRQLKIALPPFMNASLDLMGVQHSGDTV